MLYGVRATDDRSNSDILRWHCRILLLPSHTRTSGLNLMRGASWLRDREDIDRRRPSVTKARTFAVGPLRSSLGPIRARSTLLCVSELHVRALEGAATERPLAAAAQEWRLKLEDEAPMATSSAGALAHPHIPQCTARRSGGRPARGWERRKSPGERQAATCRLRRRGSVLGRRARSGLMPSENPRDWRRFGSVDGGIVRYVTLRSIYLVFLRPSAPIE